MANTRLNGVSDLARDNLGKILEANLVEFYRWGLANAGGFTNVPVPTPGTPDPYGEETLSPLHKEGVADLRVWQAPHADWCYETGLESAVQPTVAAGVYVDGVYYPTATTTGEFAHSLDFTHGRVTFSSPLPEGSTVQVAHSFRWVSLYAPDQPWFRTVVLGDYGDEAAARTAATGVAQVLDDHRVQTPFVVVQAAMGRSAIGWELGSTAKRERRDVLFYILADDGGDLKNIADAISLQEQTTIDLFDTNARRAAGAFPLDFNGTPVPDPPAYPGLVLPAPSGFYLGHAYFARMAGSDASASLPLFRGTIRATVEVIYRSN